MTRLHFLARQMQRVLAELQLIRASIDFMATGQRRTEDDIRIIKSDLQGQRADMQGLRGEMAGIRNDTRSGFDALDARLRPLENIEDEARRQDR
jgi:hypothetical protein